MKKNELIQFTEHLKGLFKSEGIVKEMPSKRPDLGPIYAFIFKDYPEKGMMSIVSYGLSEVSHPRWHFGRPELILSLDSQDESWADSLMHIVNEFRGEKSFSPGSVYELEQILSNDSLMRGFVIFTPSFISPDEGSIQLESKLVYLTQAYPIYPGEADLIQNKSFQDFWSDERLVDVYDVGRKDISK